MRSTFRSRAGAPRAPRASRDDLNLVAPIDLDLDQPPSLAAAEAEVRRAVTALAAAGAVSAETPEAIDIRIDSWCDQWVEQLQAQHTRTQDAAMKLLGAAEAEVEHLDLVKGRADLHLLRAEEDRERAAQRLGLGPVAEVAPAPNPDPEPQPDQTNEEEIA